MRASRTYLRVEDGKKEGINSAGREEGIKRKREIYTERKRETETEI